MKKNYYFSTALHLIILIPPRSTNWIPQKARNLLSFNVLFSTQNTLHGKVNLQKQNSSERNSDDSLLGKGMKTSKFNKKRKEDSSGSTCCKVSSLKKWFVFKIKPIHLKKIFSNVFVTVWKHFKSSEKDFFFFFLVFFFKTKKKV